MASHKAQRKERILLLMQQLKAAEDEEESEKGEEGKGQDKNDQAARYFHSLLFIAVMDWSEVARLSFEGSVCFCFANVLVCAVRSISGIPLPHLPAAHRCTSQALLVAAAVSAAVSSAACTMPRHVRLTKPLRLLLRPPLLAPPTT